MAGYALPVRDDDRSPERASVGSGGPPTYFDHASVGLLTPTARLRVIESLQLQTDLGSRGAVSWNRLVESARDRVAALIGAAAGTISFAKNTPEAISRVASGLSWRDGDRVLVPDCEFPANAYPWLNLRRRGVVIDWVRSRDGAVTIEAFERGLHPRTRLVAVSWVQFASGARIDLEQLATLCADRGALLLVDAIQGTGVVPLDVARAGVDFLACASHKWLGAPLGVGWLYVRPDRLNELDLHEVGQSTVRPRAPMTDYAFDLQPDARRFESGVLAAAAIAGLDGALEDLERGGGVVRTHQVVSELTSRLILGLEHQGHHVITPHDADRRAGIVSFSPRTGDARACVERCDDAGFVVATREGWVRVSLHRSNTPDEVDRFLEIV
jgi:selenocysteine lyase/cysteine desulfurase